MSYETLSSKCPYFNESYSDHGCLNRNQCEMLQAQEKAINAVRLEVIKLLTDTLSHELNNPLTSVIGFSELLLKKPSSENIRRELMIILENAYQIRDKLQFLLKMRQERVASVGGVRILMLEENRKEEVRS